MPCTNTLLTSESSPVFVQPVFFQCIATLVLYREKLDKETEVLQIVGGAGFRLDWYVKTVYMQTFISE